MKNILILAFLLIGSCVSVNPATSNYPVTGDVLEAWIDGMPYEFIDDRQYFRSLEKDSSGITGLWIDVDKKGDWFVMYNVSAVSDAALGPDGPPTPTAKFAPLDKTKYVERPFRK